MQTAHFGGSYTLTKEESDRIDIIKFIAVCFVVYIHSYTAAGTVQFQGERIQFQLPPYVQALEYYLSQVVAFYAVPMFFLLSAVLLFRKGRSWGRVLQNKAQTLLVPYLFWNSFWVLAFIFLQNFQLTKGFFSGTHTPILDCDLKGWLALYGIGAQYPQDYPLWFMRDLMVVVLCSPLIWKIADRFAKPVFVLTLLWILLDPFSAPFQAAFQYFFLGACIVKLGIRLSCLDHYPMYKLSIGYIFLSVGAFLIRIPLCRNLFFLVSIAFWVRLSKNIASCRRLKSLLLYLSSSTFLIYAAHEMTLSSFKKICARVFPHNAASALLQYLLIPVFIIALCVAADRLLQKLLPTLHKLVTGSRASRA